MFVQCTTAQRNDSVNDPSGNLFALGAPGGSGEHVEKLIDSAGVRIERIVSHGHASPEGFWYDQDENEWVVLLAGAARLRFESDNKTIELGPGDHVNIPAHTRHRVDWTQPDTDTIWLAVFYAP
ncbi:MAG: cupin domain-containing protein [Candidatus Krumholzibacteriota bacterium]|nr:cupin domain-containing protein [Candidatus Krumholzibacteriota bacterium]